MANNMTEATKKVHQRLGDVEFLLAGILKHMSAAEEIAVPHVNPGVAVELVKGRCVAQDARNKVLELQHEFTHKLAVCTPRKKKK